jgi:hypothetical protein
VSSGPNSATLQDPTSKTEREKGKKKEGTKGRKERRKEGRKKKDSLQIEMNFLSKTSYGVGLI